MKLIFLDIDGVLNSHRWLSDVTERTPACLIDPHNVAMLNTLCIATDARIVITSTWRLGEPFLSIVDWLGEKGLTDARNRVIGMTPRIRQFQTAGCDSQRGMEIEAWLLICTDDIEIESILIIDDDSDFGRLKPYWMRTTLFDGPETLDPIKYDYSGPYSGLQYPHVTKGLAMLADQANVTSVMETPHPHWNDEGLKLFYPDLPCNQVVRPTGGLPNPSTE